MSAHRPVRLIRVINGHGRQRSRIALESNSSAIAWERGPQAARYGMSREVEFTGKRSGLPVNAIVGRELPGDAWRPVWAIR